jgi:type I restriction enzyme S subunit
VNSQKAIYELQTGGAQPHILPSDLAPIVIRLPEKEEQTAIADILSDMDKEIDMLKLKLSKAKHIKFGMMSDLLTGRVRMASTSDIWRKS